MSFTLSRASKLVVAGDSIPNTAGPNGAWNLAPGGFNDQVNQVLYAGTYPARFTGLPARSTGLGARVSATAVPSGLITENDGVNGSKWAALATNVATRIVARSPTHVIIVCGVNDATGATAPATVTANMATVFDALLVYRPTIQVIVVGILTAGEAWNTGPVWNNSDGVVDAAIAAINAAMQAQCIAYQAANPNASFTYRDTRNAALAMEPAGNPGKSGSGYLTTDGTHPKTTTGQLIPMASSVIAAVTYA